jgi:NADP-dependent 3-hydroxy acid dehydrogenase YdfG
MLGLDFSGKTAVITGAGRGLGAAFAVVLADLGARVILAGRNMENLKVMAEHIRARSGERPDVLHFDLADPGAVTQTAKAMRDAMETLDILINNGAPWLPGAMTEHDAHAIVTTIGATVTGTLLFTRGLIPPLERSGAGDILNIVSISGLPNFPLHGAAVAYKAAKYGQAGLTDGLREELRGRPIRVTGVYPSWIEDVSPLDEKAWNAVRPASNWATNRDVVEASLYAISRPRHVTLSSIIFDPDKGGFAGP